MHKQKLLIEKTINEKLEMKIEYLALKHELLCQHDKDLVSVGSGRSSRSQSSNRQKVEAWIKHQNMSTDVNDFRNKVILTQQHPNVLC